jgi:mRNA interferase MazF
VLADAGRGDWILCQVTSKPYGDPQAIPLGDEDFSEGSLKLRSFARPGKLFTASSGLMVAEVGTLKDDSLSRIVGGVIAILQENKHDTTA